MQAFLLLQQCCSSFAGIAGVEVLLLALQQYAAPVLAWQRRWCCSAFTGVAALSLALMCSPLQPLQWCAVLSLALQQC